jgi:hypothetical protein
MSWVDDRLDDQKRSERDRALISLQAEKVYEELWKEISDRVGDAAKRGTPVATMVAITSAQFWRVHSPTATCTEHSPASLGN